MNLTARGYALLNDRLAPDIAVLEGGYSIERALPYVNVGIILAMAGIDYSNMREPDFDPAVLQRSTEITSYIEREVAMLYDFWENRNMRNFKTAGHRDFMSRAKHISCDTSGISEEQKETVKICRKCGELATIESTANLTRCVFAVIVPSLSCRDCRSLGEKIFEKTDRTNYDRVYFQDRHRNLYIMKQKNSSSLREELPRTQQYNCLSISGTALCKKISPKTRRLLPENDHDLSRINLILLLHFNLEDLAVLRSSDWVFHLHSFENYEFIILFDLVPDRNQHFCNGTRHGGFNFNCHSKLPPYN